MFQVYDRHTGALIGKPVKSRTAARKSVDRRDNEYGAYRYGYRAVNSNREEF